MGKQHKNKKRSSQSVSSPILSWQDDGEFHALIPGSRPSSEKIDKLTKKYQENIRNSPLWDKMVKQFGLEEAERLLKQCKAEVK